MLGAFVEILASSVLQKLKAKQLVITCCGASASSVYEFLSRCAVQNDNYQLSRILGVVSVFPDYHPSACICDIGCLIITSSENYGAYHRCFMANPQAIVVSGDGIGIEDLDKNSGAVSLWVARTIAKVQVESILNVKIFLGGSRQNHNLHPFGRGRGQKGAAARRLRHQKVAENSQIRHLELSGRPVVRRQDSKGQKRL